MDISRAKRYVLDTVRAYSLADADGMPLVEPRMQRPLFLVGPPGIGKTAIMEQVAAELGVGLVAYSMTHHTRQSALGLPVVEHRCYGDFEYDASEYTMSEIIAAVYDYMTRTGVDRGILFLDEINCVSETLYPSMLQFLQFKTFGKHEVPAGWVIVCAGNPPEYNRSVHEFDIATLDRLRRIEVDPDFEAWKAYAADAGVHAAVTTFLEAERDCFYRIESTPGGKRFVTARAWDDLSRMIALNEQLQLPVEQDLVEQFVQDPEIAEKFTLYYDLFSAYRSDYQVPRILAGECPREIVERASAARMDERMAVMGLIVDTLVPQAADALVQERALTGVRDVLRGAKDAVMGGQDARAALQPAIDEREGRLQRIAESRLSRACEVRQVRRELDMLKACAAAPLRAGAAAGDAAFLEVHQEFRGFAGPFEAMVSSVRGQFENAYAFLEEAFGDGHELLLFTTELTARKDSALFISSYGCEAFGRHSQEMQTGERQRDLTRRIGEAQANARESKGAEGSRAPADPTPAGHVPPRQEQALASGRGAVEGRETAADSAPAGLSPARQEQGGRRASGTSASEPSRTPAGELGSYYRDATWEFGYASLCHMALPAGLEGKTVLDIGCRRGKGVFKLSDRVGRNGRAIGIDWVKLHIDEATERMERAARDTGLPQNNMQFHLAYPEDLMAAGIGNATVDVAFVNSVLHLTCNPAEALAELQRVLKPGGLLICEVALAEGPRDRDVVAEARTLGNSIQAAPDRAAFESALRNLGFTLEVVEGPNAVSADQGFKRGHKAPTAPSAEDVAFNAYVFHARKQRMAD